MIGAGIDIGSRSIGLVLMDTDGTIIHQEIMDSGYDPIGRAKSHVAGFKYDLMVATGYGRHAANAQFADQVITEIKAYARGARLVAPDIRSILDIGGQDTKAILLNKKGAVEEFFMNEKCAAGTGKFLEVMAVALGYTLDEFAESSFAAQGEPIKISSMCTVFAESEVVSLLHTGAERENVARAVHKSIAERAAGMLKKTGVIQPAMFAGGGAKNRFLRKALEERLNITFIVPPEPQLIGAMGAAWEANHLLRNQHGKTRQCSYNKP